ncbi:hypothetical protein Fcan01_08328 [Folsomia candida]|uniref:Uncharacterized protein n=1 Tax=Folsomia candida TaxID=158441 RepID=A0A226EMC2_FOLCA|nr:hypothetical protein Fcan01_08328 [Folsomia candida]
MSFSAYLRAPIHLLLLGLMIMMMMITNKVKHRKRPIHRGSYGLSLRPPNEKARLQPATNQQKKKSEGREAEDGARPRRRNAKMRRKVISKCLDVMANVSIGFLAGPLPYF